MIMFALLVGFIVFITVRGELQSYLYVLGLAAAPGAAAAAPSIVPPQPPKS